MPQAEIFMQRALALATQGAGAVSPNPLVGCVIVHNGQIIGEGYHQRYGHWHAERNAIESVSDKSILSESTVYVTLEPCSHYGKTPPCANLLIEHRVAQVVICNTDPFPLVAGRGIEKLKKAGVEVEIGLLANTGRWLNRRFFTFVEKQRPHIILKWAESADGFMAKPLFGAVQISSYPAKQLLHRWRSEEDAIMIGTNTARYDNPHLTVREWAGRSPVRVVIDRHNSLPKGLHIFDGAVETLVYREDIPEILQDLYERKLQSLIVEGGPTLLQSFINQGLFDEIRVFRSNTMYLHEGIKAPVFEAKILKTEEVSTDTLTWYVP